jgi:hypothetical protein
MEVGKMKKFIAICSGLGISLALASSSVAGSFEDSMTKCLTKNANTRDSAVVMLGCTANCGKLSDCKVLSDSAPGKGFDKAAICVADALPMGGKTGEVKVPMRFPGGG